MLWGGLIILVLTVTLWNKNRYPYTSVYLFSGNMTCTCTCFCSCSSYCTTQTIHVLKGEILMKTMNTHLFRSRFIDRVVNKDAICITRSSSGQCLWDIAKYRNRCLAVYNRDENFPRIRGIPQILVHSGSIL